MISGANFTKRTYPGITFTPTLQLCALFFSKVQRQQDLLPILAQLPVDDFFPIQSQFSFTDIVIPTDENYLPISPSPTQSKNTPTTLFMDACYTRIITQEGNRIVDIIHTE